jgi:hypothetical protein
VKKMDREREGGREQEEEPEKGAGRETERWRMLT